ncbi:MAG: DUF3365 domain-containing protein [Pontiellaceae bacterium]|nr:DUF3365 domain-containing protein [Pontiellaceae bacterium]MBN2784299.1 DUF3365 domain-containing protein [Pontiellaceae bacterium]
MAAQHKGISGTARWTLTVATLCWSALILLSLYQNWHLMEHSAQELAMEQARSSIQKDVIYRDWNAKSGGVYVPVSEESPPNPYLSDHPGRDLITTTGVHLTLINPAYMTRQVHEIADREYGVRGHITSLNPIRPENGPDDWEREALLEIEEGAEEVMAVIRRNGKNHLRYLRPLLVQQSCLHCHAKQGYKLGDTRGGISVEIPLETYEKTVAAGFRPLLIGHLLVWLLGLISIFSLKVRMQRRQLAKQVEIEHLASKITAHFIRQSPGKIDQGIDRALSSIGEFSGADRVSVFQFQENNTHYDITHEWHRNGHQSPGDLYKNLSAEKYRWLIHKLQRGELVMESSTERLPEDARELRELLEMAGVKSFMAAPLIPNGQLAGMLAAVTLTKDYSWKQDEMLLLQLASETIMHVLERDRSEKALTRQTERLNRILEGTAAGTWEWNLQTGELIVNDRWAGMIGFSLEEIAPVTVETWRDAYHPEDWRVVDDLLRKCISREEDYFLCESRILHKDGHWVWVLERGKITHWTSDGNPEWMYGMRADISARKQQEELRLKISEQLQQALHMESLGILAGGIAHDFNNILMAIMGQAEMAMLSLSPNAPELQDMKEIVDAARKASGLCEQMLTYAGKGSSQKDPLVIPKLIEDIFGMLKSSIAPKARMLLDLDSDISCVHADHAQMRQVLINLVLNAAEACGDKPCDITISCGKQEYDEEFPDAFYVIPPAEEITYNYIEVSDNGCGVAPADISRIFEPFFSTKFTGRGLGLAAVRGIIQEHKGAIRVHSVVDLGTSVRILIPPCKKTDPCILTKEEDHANWKGKGMVLLVDDEETVRSISSRTLQWLGLEVLTADDGPAAISLYQDNTERINAVLLDLTMPHMSGEKVLDQLRMINPKVCVIIASGYSEAEIADIAREKQVAGYLQKPYTLSKLRSVLAPLLPPAD